MKKLALVLAVVGFMAVSCKKEVACQCTVLGITTTGAYAKLSKKDADAQKKSCEGSSTAGLVSCKQVTK